MGEQRRTKIPCPHGCGSSDGATEYEAENGTIWTKCFVCGENKPTAVHEAPEEDQEEPLTGEKHGPREPADLSDRALQRGTAKAYGVLREPSGAVVFPYGPALKVRREGKVFSWDGNKKDKSVPLFGMDRFAPGSAKMIVVTEGEFDAMAAYQMQGSKYPSVSVRNGAQGALADCQAAYDWLDSFQTIVIAFDADKPGQEAAKKVAELFAGKSKVVKHDPDLKDANGYLMHARSADWLKAMWDAEEYRPDGVVNFADLWDDINTPAEPALCLWPWPEVNAMTDGIMEGTITLLTAGSGIGKSTVCRALVDKVMREHAWKTGLIFLEENKKTTAKKQLGMHMGIQLHRTGVQVDADKLRQAFLEMAQGRKLEIYSHLGIQNPDDIISRMRYMVKALGVRLLVLDHISIIVSGMESDNERKDIDLLMTKLRSFTEETRAALVVVSHLKKVNDRKSHEEGGRITLDDLRGSGALKQLSDTVIAFERDQQAEDREERARMLVRILKCRQTGEVGPASITRYDRATGRILYVGAAESNIEEAL